MLDHNSESIAAHQILYEFESAFRQSRVSAFEFIQNASVRLNPELQMEIIAVGIELESRSGQMPSLDRLQQQFSYLDSDLRKLYTDTIQDFVKEYCPIRSVVGPLPQTVDAYHIVSEIARGGMGVVYRAKQLLLDRDVALKVLFFSRDEILREARSLALLLHPNICTVFDVGMIAGMPFMAMQYISGQRLSDCIAEDSPLSIHRCVQVICKVANAMQEAHDLGITHLDIKPSNIILSGQKEPILTDFGLARRVSEGRSPWLGSPSYMPREMLISGAVVQRHLCDIYSLATVLFEMLTARRAFSGTTEHVIDQILHDPMRRPRDYRADISLPLEQVCLRAMNKDPALRFQSMIEFHDALIGCLG